MIKPLLVFVTVLFLCLQQGKSQCPLLFNTLGTPTSQPLFTSCSGNAFTLNVQAASSFGTYTINWGDSSPNTTGASYSTSGPAITHAYPATINVYTITLNIPSLSCSMTSTLVVEKPVNASIQIPTLGLTTACAPKTLTFTNSSTDVSPTTTFTWTFGDNSTPLITTFTNAGTSVLHQYLRGTVNCQTQVTLKALNYCSFGNPTIANFNPINIYDLDSAIIIPDKIVRCLPDNIFTFTNGSIRNCNTTGNTFQRQEKWNFGNYWGFGHDSIIGWRPWPPSNPISIAYPQNVGGYNIVLSDSNLCGVKTKTITVSIITAPVAGLAAPLGLLCQNSPLTFTNLSTPGYAYRWDFGTGSGTVNLGSATTQTFSYVTPGTYTVKLIAMINGAGGACSDTAFATVNILPSPTASFALSPTVGCNVLSNVSFTNLSTGNSGSNWSFGNGVTSTLSTPPSQNYTLTGVSTISLNVVSASGCVNTLTRSVLVRSNPVPAFQQFTACVATAVTFTNNSTASGTNAISGYTWNFGDGSAISTSSAPVKTYTAQGTYTLKLIASTGFCSDSLKLPVNINVKPTANFITSPTVGCTPFAMSFSNTSVNFTNLLWKFGTTPASTSNATNTSFTYTNTSQNFQGYTITLIASTGAGCADSIKKAISVRPKPVPNFSVSTATGCSPLVTTFTNSSIGYSTTAWSFGDGSTSSNVIASHTYSNQTLFTQTVSAKLVVTNSVSCRDSSSQVITIYPLAVPVFTVVPASGCSPLKVDFPSIPGIATYTWNHGDGSPTFTTVSSHSYTFINTGTVNAVYTVSMTALTSNGCIGSNTQTVMVFANPVANFAFTPTAACSPATINFTNASTNNAGNKWEFGNGQTSGLADPVANYTNSAGSAQSTFTVKLLVFTANGCRDSTAKMFNLYPLPKASFGLDTPACAPKVVTFTNTSSGGFSSRWNFGDGAASTSSNPSHLYTNTTIGNKTFTVKLITTSQNNCQDSVSVQMVVHPKPTFFISSAPDSGCSPVKVFFRKLVGITKYEWRYDNIGFGSAGDISNTFENKGTNTRNYKVELIATDVFQCRDTAEKIIKVFPVPDAKYSVSPLTVYVPNQPAQFTNLSTSAASYTWSFGDGAGSTVFSPQHTYTGPGEYTTSLIITNNKGCRDTFSLPDKVVALNETTVIVPNAFTPSAEGPKGGFYNPKDLSNDVFYPNIKGTDRYLFSIYSRWGELLFETKNPDEGWDGYYKGKLCMQDVYIWKINATFIDGRTYSKSGDLLLLR